MLSKVLKDRPGVVPVEQIRIWFELIISGTASLGVPLDRSDDGMTYKNTATQHFFLGFGIGIRHAERMAKAGTPVEEFSEPIN